MKRRQREAFRARAEGQQQHAREVERVENDKKTKLAEAALQVLANQGTLWKDRVIARLDPGPRSFIRQLLEGPAAGRKLVLPSERDTLCRLARVEHLRPLATWKPQGKGRGSVFRSLCEHLLAKYPTPRFLWSAFAENDQNAALLMPLVVHVAGGGSLFQYCKSGRLPLALTRAQCLEFIETPAEFGIVSALRRVQVKAEGGDNQLFSVWRNLERNKMIGTATEEEFRLSVLRFFARNPMFSREQIAPVCDFVFRRFRENPAFSMQGRTVAALTRAMNEWHRELNQAGGGRRFPWQVDDRPSVKFERSGFRSYRVEKEDGKLAKRGFANVVVWTIQEIVSSEDLRAEGKALHHCVYSYRSEIEAKEKSIWSLSVSDEFTPSEKLITLEVNNKTKAIVQARGAHNRRTKPQEDRVIIEWARRNSLTVDYGNGW